MDSPLKDVSANMRDMKLGASPSKGGALKPSSGRLGLSRKDRLDTVPSSSADLKVGITRDWQGPDKALKPKVATSISVGICFHPSQQFNLGRMWAELTSLCAFAFPLTLGRLNSVATATFRIESSSAQRRLIAMRTQMATRSGRRSQATLQILTLRLTSQLRTLIRPISMGNRLSRILCLLRWDREFSRFQQRHPAR